MIFFNIFNNWYFKFQVWIIGVKDPSDLTHYCCIFSTVKLWNLCLKFLSFLLLETHIYVLPLVVGGQISPVVNAQL